MKSPLVISNVVHENQRGLHLRGGRIVREVGPGVYLSTRFGMSSYFVYSMSAQVFNGTISVNTSDMANIFIDVPANVYIRDVRKHYLSGISVYEAVSRAVGKIMQEQLGDLSLAEVLDSKLEIPVDAVNLGLAELGLEVSLEGAVRIRLPRNLQNAIDAQEVARQRAKAELEEARGRTAVLRHYANAAKMTKDNPELLRLMLGQKAKSINVAFDASK